ncbi:hypothetical protein BUALT_Bualt16G0008700 [Buddleja alternifolia]|uniref:DUF4005 domain-containing protein n=1 Tax=Buddleja alternifolia TaxID=168488 RepID=A0AAV6WDF6_9LAMI|nr:hypothetical protein BUALT_Bualt16G0008700 [Buddleja alternifolia]
MRGWKTIPIELDIRAFLYEGDPLCENCLLGDDTEICSQFPVFRGWSRFIKASSKNVYLEKDQVDILGRVTEEVCLIYSPGLIGFNFEELKTKSRRGHLNRKLMAFYARYIGEWNERRYNSCVKDRVADYLEGFALPDRSQIEDAQQHPDRSQIEDAQQHLDIATLIPDATARTPDATPTTLGAASDGVPDATLDVQELELSYRFFYYGEVSGKMDQDSTLWKEELARFELSFLLIWGSLQENGSRQYSLERRALNLVCPNFASNVTTNEKAAAKTPGEDLVGNSPFISDPSQLADRGAENMELEKGTSGNSCGTNALFPVNQGAKSESNYVSVTIDDAEMRRQDQAATKAQAAFRGYLARRAFRTLKGIIRLQALIRGHLVRRQAVATLRCMHAIVKFQALARGRRDAKQVDVGSNSIFKSEKLATNAFVRKLLSSLPTPMPLSLHYELDEPNSALNWLDRWSLSHFWVPPPRPKKVLNMKPLKKQAGSQIVEYGAGKSKRTIRKASTAAHVDSGALASLETDKPKRNPRKITSHQTELMQEQHQSELERVKHSLKKVSSSEKSEMETESNSAALDVSEEKIAISSEKSADLDVVVDKRAFLESPSNITNEPNDDCPFVETISVENDEKMENMQFSRDELGSKEEEIGKENQKIRKRSLPAKQEYTENISQNNPSLPSYMMATQSAKAKLRAQGTTKLSEDGAENGNIRRHSLPASTNGKLSSLSPRIRKPVQGNGKGGSKTNKLLTSSRDGAPSLAVKELHNYVIEREIILRKSWDSVS